MSSVLEDLPQRTEAATKNYGLTVADAVWIATAEAQSRQPDAVFTTDTIVNHVVFLKLTEGAYKTIWQHVNQHCVANRKPQPNRARMLFAVGRGSRRLFRDGDRFDPERADAPTHPAWEKLPARFAYLREWYENVWNVQSRQVETENDPLLTLVGAGHGMWGGLSPDQYVASLRQGWEARQ